MRVNIPLFSIALAVVSINVKFSSVNLTSKSIINIEFVGPSPLIMVLSWFSPIIFVLLFISIPFSM